MENFRSPTDHRGGGCGGGSGSGSRTAGGEAGEGREMVRTRGGFLEVPGWFGRKTGAWGGNVVRKPAKLLVKVTVQNTVGAVQVVMMSENTVHDLKKAVVEIYVREKRRPFLACSDPGCFVLHYSQYSLEGLKPEEKLKNLGSRNFYLCQKPGNVDVTINTPFQAVDKSPSGPLPFVKLMDFLL